MPSEKKRLEIFDSFYKMSDEAIDAEKMAHYREMWEKLKEYTESSGKNVRFKLPGSPTRPIDRLDEYERELCESADPADHSALILRLLMKERNIDPETVVITGCDFSCPSGDGIVVESEQLFTSFERRGPRGNEED